MYPDDYYNKDDERAVYFFSSPFDTLNNWGANALEIWGILFLTAEHAYQYKKFETSDPKVAKEIINAKSPWSVYQIARAHTDKVRSDWNDIKLAVMEEVLRAKLAQNPDVEQQLQKTAERHIIEKSPWDEFWGIGPRGRGQNNLGKLWEKLRDEKE